MTCSPLEIITRKRDGGELSQSQIDVMIEGFLSGGIPDYQMSAFAMAIYIRGMCLEETMHLTKAMLDSGTVLNWSGEETTVSKHSTGGVGDKVSLILVPLLATCGVRVPKLSGRGLGPTGGTLDKLESIPGFRTDLSISEILDIQESVGCCITGATDDIAPADKRLYALRDATATVSSIPLITSSILSKKLAENPDHLILDVKVGSGAFMKDQASAEALAECLVKTGTHLGVPTDCVLTGMDQPLGRCVGNLLEVHESIEALSGGGEARLMETVEHLAADILVSTGICVSHGVAVDKLRENIFNGMASSKFADMVSAQGGDLSLLPPRGEDVKLTAKSSGFVTQIDAAKAGWALIALGGGRERKSDSIDHTVGLELTKRVGDQISAGEDWAKIYLSGDEQRNIRALKLLSSAISIQEAPVETLPIIIDTIRRTQS